MSKPNPQVKKFYVATVQLVVDADGDYAGAVDAIVETLSGVREIVDWGFMRLGGQWAYPTEAYLSVPYEEGDAFNG